MDVTCRKSKIAVNIFLTHVEPQMVIGALVINPFGKKLLRNASEKNKEFDIKIVTKIQTSRAIIRYFRNVLSFKECFKICFEHSFTFKSLQRLQIIQKCKLSALNFQVKLRHSV